MPQGGKTRPRHERGTVMKAFEMREENPTMKVKPLARALGVHADSVRRWFDHPEKFDPFIDEVAVERAVAGDIEVYNNLTVFELEEVHARLDAIRETLANEWRGNQHMAQPEAVLWMRFGEDASRLKVNVAQYRDTILQRARRATA